MMARWLAFAVWAAVAAAAVHWATKWLARPQPVPANAVVVSTSLQPRGDLSALFGAEPPPPAPAPQLMPAPAMPTAPALASRLQLIGVVAPRPPEARGEGLALIAVDGKPAKAFRVGARIDGENVLLSVHARGAAVGPQGSAAAAQLELPPLPPPATGTLPPASSLASPGLPQAAAFTQPVPPPVVTPANVPAPFVPAPGIPGSALATQSGVPGQMGMPPSLRGRLPGALPLPRPPQVPGAVQVPAPGADGLITLPGGQAPTNQ